MPVLLLVRFKPELQSLGDPACDTGALNAAEIEIIFGSSAKHGLFSLSIPNVLNHHMQRISNPPS